LGGSSARLLSFGGAVEETAGVCGMVTRPLAATPKAEVVPPVVADAAVTPV
jgi:hypothetical protein